MDEGFGDSEDDQFGRDPAVSTGLTDELGSVGMTTTSGKSSQGKRKRGEESLSLRKKKVPASKQIADAISTIAGVQRERKDALDDTKMHVVLQMLKEVEECRSDVSFYTDCLTLLHRQTTREIFVFLYKNEPREVLLAWLRKEVDGK